MVNRRKYTKRATEFVTAVQVDLDIESFTYRKWGSTQRCKPGDWLVDNNGEVYTVDGESFARTYRSTGPGVYVKTTAVWAEIASSDGAVPTKEGLTSYKTGDYLVANEPDGGDPYAVAREVFERMYEPAQ
jgi:hypothetical protein